MHSVETTAATDDLYDNAPTTGAQYGSTATSIDANNGTLLQEDLSQYIEDIQRAVYGTEYEWGEERTVPGLFPANADGERGNLGMDFVMTDDGEMKLLEYHVNRFGTRGFSRNGAFGEGRVQDVMHNPSRGDFTDYLKTYERKDRVQDLPYTTDAVQDSAELDPDEPVVVKPTNSSRGRGVDVVRAGELDGETFSFRHGRKQVEQLVDGKEVIGDDGRRYKWCMRYVLPWEVDDGDLVLRNGGGYKRTPEKPVDDPTASLKERYVANLAQGGKALPAEDYEQELAYQTATDVVGGLFQQWTMNQAIQRP